MFDEFYVALARRGLAPRTIRQAHTVIRRALRQAVNERQLVEHNVATEATPPAAVPIRYVLPSPADVATILRLADERDPILSVALRLDAEIGAPRRDHGLTVECNRS
jgi:hypothetical protein